MKRSFNLSPRMGFVVELTKVLRIFVPLASAYFIYASTAPIGTWIVAPLGHDTIASFALGITAYVTAYMFFDGVLESTGVFVSRYFGAGKLDEISIVISQGLVLALLCSLCFGVILLAMPFLFTLTGQEPAIAAQGMVFLKAIAWSLGPWLFLEIMEQFLIGIAQARIILYVSFVQVSFEMLLGYGLVFGKWGLPCCGLAGLGYGIAIVSFLAALFLGFFACYAPGMRRFAVFKHVGRLYPPLIGSLFRVGLPIGLLTIMDYVLFFVVTLSVGSFGVQALASQQMVQQYLVIVVTFGITLAQTITIRVSHLIGRGEGHSIIFSVWTGGVFGFIFSTLVFTVLTFCPVTILSLTLSKDAMPSDDMMGMIRHLFFVAALFQFVDFIRLFFTGVLRGFQQTALPMYTTLIAFLGIGGPCAYVFGFVLGGQAIGIWYGLTIASFVTSLWLIRVVYRLLCVTRKSENGTESSCNLA